MRACASWVGRSAAAGFITRGPRCGAEAFLIGSSPWPAAFTRVPDDEWTRRPVERLAENYDTVERHGWYDNLDPTVAQLAEIVRDGDIWIDYSGGTGILIDRVLRRITDRTYGIVNVDSSPKFLRLSLEKFAAEEHVAFRWIRYLHHEHRLQFLDEVLEGPLLARGANGIVSTNAVHLYYDLVETLSSWRRSLRAGGHVLVQSGNIGHGGDHDDGWIIDETVHEVARAALDIVREDDLFAHLRPLVKDDARMARYDDLRSKYFLPVRPLSHYLDAMARAELSVQDVQRRVIRANVDEWFEFLAVYHEGVLGWIGGSERLEGSPPSARDIDDRLALMRRAMARVFENDTFDAVWTYITARNEAA